ncbi:transcription factor MYB120 [Mercurialis annua]|uniref:transcription factor MYB120 n=1 Tax=Mercurialis annua TaxID=3986 RepID=UPI00215DD7C1|nr:transcription factor MYB120 [Mercurialis annua]
MDSGNSGSLQSSSGDEEHDSSRPPESSFSAFLNNSSHFGVPLNPQSFLPHHHHPYHHHQQQQLHHQTPTLFDPSSNLFHNFSQSPSPNLNLHSSLINLDAVRSESAPPPLSSGRSSILGVQGTNPATINQLPSHSDQNHVASRNPKKRTRASRRAPTTVLTTDTSNFRAMVQEFTGIPAPPFSGSPYSKRLDLFGSAMTRSSHLEQIGSLFPLRPSAQKVPHQQSPFSFSSSPSPLIQNNPVDATTTATTAANNNPTTFINPSSFNNYQLPSDLSQLSKQPQNILNMQNQMLSFQSLFQPPSKGNLPLLPSLHDELGMSHGRVSANLSEIPSHSVTNTPEGNNRCKLNYSGSTSDHHFLHQDNGLENVPPRSEGAVDSWICPSE